MAALAAWPRRGTRGRYPREPAAFRRAADLARAGLPCDPADARAAAAFEAAEAAAHACAAARLCAALCPGGWGAHGSADSGADGGGTAWAVAGAAETARARGPGPGPRPPTRAAAFPGGAKGFRGPEEESLAERPLGRAEWRGGLELLGLRLSWHQVRPPRCRARAGEAAAADATADDWLPRFLCCLIASIAPSLGRGQSA